MLWVCVWGALAGVPKVIETLVDLGKSLHDEADAAELEFADSSAACRTASAQLGGELAAANETLGVLREAGEEAVAKVDEVEQSVVEKSLEVDQVEAQQRAETEAKNATRASYEQERTSLEATRSDLEEAVREQRRGAKKEQLFLARLRRVDTLRPLSFVQVAREDAEVALDKVREELKAQREAFEKELASHEAKSRELREQLVPLKRDLAMLVPAKAKAELAAAESSAREADVVRVAGKGKALREAYADFCATALDGLSQASEQRSEVLGQLSTATQSLESTVFTSLVETSAAALPPTFLQLPIFAQEEKSVQEVVALVQPALVQGRARGPFDDIRLKIREVVDRLREEANKDVDMTTYCENQAEENKQATARKKDELDGLQAMAKHHTARLEELTEERSAAEAAELELRELQTEVMANFSKAAEQHAQRGKDHTVAKEVVSRAATQVEEAYGLASVAGAFVQATPSEAAQQQAGQAALEGLRAAGERLAALEDTARSSAGQLEGKLATVEEALRELLLARTKQVSGLGVLLSGHEDGKLEAASSAKTAEASLAALQEEAEQQRGPCTSPDDGEDRLQRQQEEVTALQDALKVLEGESVPIGLSDGFLQTPGSPLDAAAMAMGLRVRAA